MFEMPTLQVSPQFRSPAQGFSTCRPIADFLRVCQSFGELKQELTRGEAPLSKEFFHKWHRNGEFIVPISGVSLGRSSWRRGGPGGYQSGDSIVDQRENGDEVFSSVPGLPAWLFQTITDG